MTTTPRASLDASFLFIVTLALPAAACVDDDDDDDGSDTDAGGAIDAAVMPSDGAPPDGPDGLAMCAPVDGCGGDPVGMWEIESYCATIRGLGGCAEAIAAVSPTVIGGAASFAQDLDSGHQAFELHAVATATLVYQVPAACHDAATICEQIGNAGIACVAEGVGCRCEEDLVDEPFDESAGWSIDGDVLTVDYNADGGEGDPVVTGPYCVDDDGLAFTLVNGEPDALEHASITVVLRRR